MDIGFTEKRGVAALGVALALFALLLFAPFVGTAAIAQEPDPLATRVQFLHAATDMGDVEIHINGAEELDQFGYGTVSDWIDLDAGTVRLTITMDRAGFNYAIFDGVYPVPAGNDFYVVISDSLLLTGAFDAATISGDNGRVQFTQASADLPALNIVVTGSDLAAPLTYPRTSDSFELPVGTYDIDVQLEETGESIAMLSGFNVEAGQTYQAIVMGDPTSEEKPVEVQMLQTATNASPSDTPAATPAA